MTDDNEGAAGYSGPSVAPAAAADTLPYPESIMRRYRRPDGTLDTPISEIVRIEETCKRERFEQGGNANKYRGGKSSHKDLPF